MSDIDFLMLHARFAGFRIMVMANRVGCSSALGLKAHDSLIVQLDKLAGMMRAGLAAERRILLNTDPAKNDDLGEELWYCERNYIEACDPEGIDLLGTGPCVDWGTREWYDPRCKIWVSFYDAPPPSPVTVPAQKLCGLDRIILQIAEETGVRFTTYVSASEERTADPANFDPECYEDLHGFHDDEDEHSAIHDLVNGLGGGA
ncbi:hypothetical protein [Rhizobium binxianense]|jgi:hypothetical protein